MAKGTRISRYRGPNSRKVNRAKTLEKAKKQKTRQENQLKKIKLRNDMKKFNKEWKLKNKQLNIQRSKINKTADNIRATGAAVAENLVPATTAEYAVEATNNHNKNNQIYDLINSGVKKASTENEEESSNGDFNWR